MTKITRFASSLLVFFGSFVGCSPNAANLSSPGTNNSALSSGALLTEQPCSYDSSEGAPFVAQPNVAYLILPADKYLALGIPNGDQTDGEQLTVDTRTNGIHQLFYPNLQASGAYTFTILATGLQLNSSSIEAVRQISAKNAVHYQVLTTGDRYALMNVSSNQCLTETSGNQRFALTPFKRGFATPSTSAVTRLQNLQGAWFYDWGNNPRGGEIVPATLEFVPMMYGYPGGSQPTADLTADLAYMYGSGYTTVLAYNEPDGKPPTGSNVDQGVAARSWPIFEASGMRAGSPSAVNPTDDWMQAFATDVGASNIPFVTVHWYGYGASAAKSFLKRIDDTYNQYQRPIWVTEFAIQDFQAPSAQQDTFSPQDVVDFLNIVLPALDNNPHVERYFYQDSSPSFNNGALLDDNNQPTAPGAVYAHNPL